MGGLVRTLLSMVFVLFWECLNIGAPAVWAQTDPERASAEEEAAVSALSDEEKAELKALIETSNAFNETVTPIFGVVELPKAGVTLDLGEDFYFLNAADAKRVLEEAWGNPPGMEALGMIFEKETYAYSNDYAVAVTFDKSGYVSDEDARDINYDKLLKDMKKEFAESSKSRVKEGYDSIELVGWAEEPKYDDVNKRLLWAKSLRFGGAEDLTLNYNMRFLGRKGVLEFNYIASEEALDIVHAAMPQMMKVAEFKEGHRYADFNASTDQVAAYGVAGLIAGGVAAKKFGLLAVLLLLLKKGWFVVLAAFAYGGRFIKKIFGKEDA